MTFPRPAPLAASALALVGLLAMASAVLANPTGIEIVDKTFSPADLTVNVGDTVVWTVTKAISEPHSVTSGSSGDPDSGKLFDSKPTLKNDGDKFEWKFETAGSFAYYCQVHPTEMKGTITVLAPGASAPPAGSGGPASSGAPEASEAPGGSERGPITTSEKLTAAGILAVVIVLLFGSAWYYRRINR